MKNIKIIPVDPNRFQKPVPKGGFHIPQGAEIESVTFDVGSGACVVTWTADDVNNSNFGLIENVSSPVSDPIIVLAAPITRSQSE